MSSSLGAITLDSLSRGVVHCFEVSWRNGARPLMTFTLFGSRATEPASQPVSLLVPRKRSYLFHPPLLPDLFSNNSDAIFTRRLPAETSREKGGEREGGCSERGEQSSAAGPKKRRGVPDGKKDDGVGGREAL